MERLKKAKELRSKKINKVEHVKSTHDPMDVYEKLDEIAAKGYAGLSKEDSSYFLKCFGLFDKGSDFMLRVRIPGGRLEARQAAMIGSIAQEFGNDYIDLSTRMQVVLRYLPIDSIAIILDKLRSVGLSTFQTGVDNQRNFVTDPLDGLAFDNIIETGPLMSEIEKRIIENPEWISTMPRKFNTAFLGSLSNSCNIYGHDCSFALAQRDGVFGFNLYLGGRVGVQAKNADMFILEDEVPSVYKSILKLFREYGYRDNRNKNRLHFLLQDVGMDAFVDAIKQECGREYPVAGIDMVQSHALNQQSDRISLKDGTFAYKLTVPAGVFSGTDMIACAKAAKEYSSTAKLRLGYDQNIYIVQVPPSNASALEKSSIAEKYFQFANMYYRDMIACAGTHTCSFGVIPNKPDAIELAEYLHKEVAINDGLVRTNWSACPKGCGLHGIGDIGLEGCKAKNEQGERVDGVHLYIGGKMTRGAQEAHTLHKTLPISEARHHIKYIMEAYKSFKLPRETFEAFESRYLHHNYSYQAIAFYTKINYVVQERVGLDLFFALEAEPKTKLNEAYELFVFGLRLFELLTGEKRFDGVDGMDPILERPRSIKRDSISKLNPAIPHKLSEVIYNMTHENRSKRAQVFSELIVALKEI